MVVYTTMLLHVAVQYIWLALRWDLSLKQKPSVPCSLIACSSKYSQKLPCFAVRTLYNTILVGLRKIIQYVLLKH